MSLDLTKPLRVKGSPERRFFPSLPLPEEGRAIMGIMRAGHTEPYVTHCHPMFLENVPENVPEPITTPLIMRIDKLGLVTIEAPPLYQGISRPFLLEPGTAVVNVVRDADGRVTVTQIGTSS
jgi:hypothetical protein